MKQLLKQKEKEKLQSTFKTHPLLSTCYKVFSPRMAKLDGLQVTPEDVFRESARLLDFLISKPGISQHQVDSLWTMMLNDIRAWKAEVTLHDKRMVAGTIFMLVRVVLSLHYKTIFCETLFDMLTTTIERELSSGDDEEQNMFLSQLSECIPVLSSWALEYEDEEQWLSEEIEDALSARDGHGGNKDFKPSGRTFTKTALITDTLIVIICQRLSKADKLDASPDDFLKLFSGVNQQFVMTWKGKPGELRELFKMLTDDGYVTPKRGYQDILKSHFIDVNANRFINIHGDKTINSFQPIIDDCSFLLQHLPEGVTAIMKKLLNENKDALNEMGYFDKLQLTKQSGLSIRNKLR